MKTVRRPPYPKWNPGYFPCSSLTPPFRFPHAVHRCPSVDSGLDPGNQDATAFLAASERASTTGPNSDVGPGAAQPSRRGGSGAALDRAGAADQPTSFADGRYQVTKFLGEGGKKLVYLAHDGTLDREVAFALIKTEGLDETSRTRITREAQAMGRLGAHPHIVTVFDLGEHDSQPFHRH